MICEFLFYEEDGEKKEKINYIDLKIQIRELIKNRFDREVLTGILMGLRKDVSGKTRSELFQIYQDLELHEDAYQKLNSWRWELVSKGIYELTQMEVKDSYSLITRFINDKRTTIRKQAEIATVSLKEEGIIYFLDHTKYRISEWQQLKLLDVVRNKTDYEPPAFRLWLTSKNNDVVLFSLRLIKYYNQNDASASLIQLLRHKSDAIKKEVIFCIRDFNVTDAVPVLKTIFWKCTTDVKMFLLEALSQLGTEEDIGFLEDVIDKEMAFTVKGKAISALNTIRPEGVLPTQDILPKEDFQASEPLHHSKTMSTNENAVSTSEKEELMNKIDISAATEILVNNTEDLSACSMEIEADQISFLPIVTEDTSEKSLETLEDDVKDAEKQTDLMNLTVSFEEVFPSTVVNELHFEFLPIVTAESCKQEKQTLNDLPVRFEAVKVVDKLKTDQDSSVECVINEIVVTFEELLVPKKTVVETQVLEKNSKLELKFIEEESILDFSETVDVSQINVVYDLLKVDKDSTSKNPIVEIDWCSAFDFQKVTHPEKSILENNIENDIKNDMEKELERIPKPLFYDDSVLNTTALLEDIAELGDHREIPHLKMLLKQETNAALQTRITELIASFSVDDDIQISFEPTILPERQSVFHNLFEVSDTEAKIILLDEIAEIGDEQEIALLETFLSNENLELQKVAKRALDTISSRLTSTNKIASWDETKIAEEKSVTFEPDNDNLFTVDFDSICSVDDTISGQDRFKNQKDGNTLFDHLCAMSTNLYKKE